MLSNEDLRSLLTVVGGKKPLVHYDFPPIAAEDKHKHRKEQRQEKLAGDICDRVQGASIDLTVGRIRYVERNGFSGEVRERADQLTLPPTHIAVVETAETLAIPDTHAAIMFPKSSNLAQRGLLVTNFGHVDPGFNGKLTFTVINTSNERFKLKFGEPLATLLLFKLDTRTSKPFQSENSAEKMDEDEVRMLGPDFLHIHDRATEIAGTAVRSASLVVAAVSAAVSTILSLAISIGTIFMQQRLFPPETPVQQQAASTNVTEQLSRIEELVKQRTEAPPSSDPTP